MSAFAIRSRGLGKLYELGERRQRYRTLRDRLGGVTRSLRSRDGRAGRSAADTLWALKDVSFDIRPGEVVGFVGRNGAGKTTLLKLFSRITDPTEGHAEIRGRIASLLEVGTGFHQELTGRENIFLSGAILGMRRAEIERKFDEIASFSGVERFLDTQVKHYSSGMYLRLAFAVAAHLEPEVLMVDEVLAVGDVAFQRKCLGKMDSVARSGRTILFVSHDLEAVQRLCDRCIWLEGGRIALDGETGSVVAAYLAQWRSALASTYVGDPTFTTSDGIALLSAELLGADGVPCQQLRFGEPFGVRMTWLHGEPISGASYFLRLYDSRERLMLAANTVQSDLRSERAGRHRLLCSFETNVLVPGEYRIAVGCARGSKTVLLSVDSCLGLVVTEVAHGNAPLPRIHRDALMAPFSRWEEQALEPALVDHGP